MFADALAMAGSVVAAVRPEDLERPTACAEWNVRDVLGHLVATVRQAERVGRGARTSAAGIARLERRDRWAPTFAAAARKARAAWADGAAPPTEVRVPWGLVPTPVALAGFVLEVVAHTHDVAAGIGRTDLLDERLGNAALGIAERFLPAALRGSGAVFAEPVAVPATAGSYERLAAFLGRAPGPNDQRRVAITVSSCADSSVGAEARAWASARSSRCWARFERCRARAVRRLVMTDPSDLRGEG